ncbi:carbohydrate ABC transporter permease [Mycoplasmopsis columbina]|uniref:carbohydrate ABC transporter permease n=1 Tax=Mycoplasmopsis columbina TaxID=114881 RepID=UPI0004A7214D|nr:carbohydrate ABC transporter permease [Mycoplasmopsis columbina]
MFETKLKIHKWWLNIKLKRNRDKTAEQVKESDFFASSVSFVLKLLILCFFGLIILFPFFFMLMLAVFPREQAEALKVDPTIFPKQWDWSNFVKAWNGSDSSSYFTSFGITFLNVLFSIFAKTLITMLGGYAFSIKKWKGKEFLWSVLIALLVLPEVALLSGQYRIIAEWHNAYQVNDNFFGLTVVLAVPFVASVFSALMFRTAFESIPSRIKEVATVDGAVGVKYFFKIAAPMVTPTTLTVIILTALSSWNSYLWPSLVANGNIKVLSVWLFEIGQDKTDPTNIITLQNIKMAGSILAILPMFVFYLLFRKRIMSAISRQGSTIKG